MSPTFLPVGLQQSDNGMSPRRKTVAIHRDRFEEASPGGSCAPAIGSFTDETRKVAVSGIGRQGEFVQVRAL
jgi:hypothetical protein